MKHGLYNSILTKSRGDGKRAYGMTIFPGKRGNVWPGKSTLKNVHKVLMFSKKWPLKLHTSDYYIHRQIKYLHTKIDLPAHKSSPNKFFMINHAIFCFFFATESEGFK